MPSDLPVFNLVNVFRCRDLLLTRCVHPRLGQRLEGQVLHSLASALRDQLPNGISRDSIYESVRYLAGQVLEPRNGVELCWRLAGNIDRLKSGVAVCPWTMQPAVEWVPLQILRCQPGRNRRNKLGYNFSFRILAGSPCPMQITAFWSRELCNMLARRLGFSRWLEGRYPYRNAVELVGLRLLGELTPERSQQAPGFYEVAVTPSLKKWNVENVLQVRCRVQPCPRGYTGACNLCVIGYKECPAATHRENFVSRFCAICGTENAWFDPESTMDRCINCHHKELTRKVD